MARCICTLSWDGVGASVRSTFFASSAHPTEAPASIIAAAVSSVSVRFIVSFSKFVGFLGGYGRMVLFFGHRPCFFGALQVFHAVFWATGTFFHARLAPPRLSCRIRDTAKGAENPKNTESNASRHHNRPFNSAAPTVACVRRMKA